MARGGKRPGAGRKKGSPNRTTAQIRDAIMEAFERKGGVDYLEELAGAEPKTFAMLLARILPTEFKGEVSVSPLTELLNRIDGKTKTLD